jgi:enamine deaminase RidA (YjgF/YER057c/UK114 family)
VRPGTVFREMPIVSAEAPQAVQPAGWPTPSGYAHGVVASLGATGRVLAVAGQIGAARDGTVVAGGLVAQFDQALGNLLEVVAAAGGAGEHVIAMTMYVLDVAAYRAARPALGEAWRRRLGRHFPAITLVAVSGLVDEDAVVEISGLAVLP